MGFREEFGRSILIATNQFQADLLWRGYVIGEHEQFAPAPGQEGFADRVLNVIASKICTNKDELREFFLLTYLGFQQRKQKTTFEAETEKALAALAKARLVTVHETGQLEATTLGEAAARKGIRATTAVKLARFFEASRGRQIADLELLHLLSLTEDGKRVQLPLSTAEHRSRAYESKLNEWAQDQNGEFGEELNHVLHAKMLPTSQEVRSAKLSLLLMGWIKGQELSGLESSYQCYAGTIKAQTEEVSWLAEAAAEVADVMGWSPSQQISNLAERVRFGVDADGLTLARANLPGLGREEVRALVAAGFDSVTALREASPDALSRYLSAEQIASVKESRL